MKRKLLTAVALTSGALLGASGASAATTVSIGECTGSASCSPVLIPGATGTGSASATGLTTGIWDISSINGTGSPPLTPPTQLLSNTITLSSAGSGTLVLVVTAQGNATPLGVNTYASGFTVNSLSANLSVQEMTLNDPNNGLFSTQALNGTDLLDNATFPGPITSATGTNASHVSLSDNNPFSVTEEYLITSTGTGSGNLTINLQSVATPEPASLTLLGSALVGLGWLGRRRRKAA